MDTTIIFLIISYLLIAVGIIGIIIPGIPGLVFIMAGILVYGWHVGFEVLGYNFLITMILLTIIGTVIDILGSILGAKKYGASKLSILAMVIGLIFGLMTLGPPGLIIGPVVAVIFTEMLISKRSFQDALKVTLGIVLGFLSGIAVRFIIGIAMTISFTIKVILMHFSI